MIIGNAISPFGRKLSGGISYSSEAIALFDKWESLGTPADDTRKTLVNNTIVALKSASVWNSLDFLYVWTAHSQTASLVDWKNPTTRSATVDGTMTFVADSHFVSNGTTGRLALGYNPGDGGTYNFTQNDNSYGVYTLDRVVENKIEISAQSAGSVGNDMLLTSNITTKNNSGTARAVAVMNGYGLASCHRTASNAFQNYRNGYWVYGIGATPTDASNAVVNLEWQEFCRNVNGTFSSFSTKKHAFSFAGASLNSFTLSYEIEKYFLQPLGVAPSKRITFNGNSYTSAAVYVNRVLADLGTYFYDVNSVGLTGNTTVQVQANAVTTVFPYTKSFLTKNIYFFWELTNDMANNSSNATTCYNNLVAYCVALKAAQPDAIIIVATCLPRNSASMTNANRQNDADLFDDTTLNGKIRNHLVQDGYAYSICDVASDATMGIYSGGVAGVGEKNTTYYDVDEIHPTTAGYNLLADTYIHPSIAAVL